MAARPAPIDSSYVPSAALTKLPANAPLQDILDVIEQDGGVILTGLVSGQDLAAIKEELEPYTNKVTDGKATEGDAMDNLFPKETQVIAGLVGKSPTAVKMCENEVLHSLQTAILEHSFTAAWEDFTEEHTVHPLLSTSLALNIGPGAPRQKLHRDDINHGVPHGSFNLKQTSQITCLVAGVRTTRENGATMFVPGSHKWDDSRFPRLDEVCFAEMDPGSALVFVGSAYHGGGHNATTDVMRIMYSFFFIRGTMRPEENQFLAVPRSKVLNMSDKMLSLLGYKKPTTYLGLVNNDDPTVNLPAVLAMATA
ncbi:Dioxygenase swnH1 [Cladobotryum mycophilum]|uniref:Dioxygenase swnH1 n=1 Tax=Cladobotryum mycophilum TaxID=491253 RepID=A0ABR0SXC2_9HYPO